jgi:transmembrane sensor
MSTSSDKPTGAPLDWPFAAGLVDDIVRGIERKAKLRERRRRRLAASVASLVVLGAIALWGIPYLRHTDTFATPAAQRQTLALADGSSAELNAGTQLKTDFRYGRRVVRLTHGEAFFAVAKDDGEPFLVETPSGTVRVTGTEFNVRLGATGTAEVTLFEGSVAFQGRSSTVTLAPGEQLDADTNAVRTLNGSDLDGVKAWRNGFLVMDSLTLGDVTARIASFHDVRIDIEGSAAALRPGGTVPLADLRAVLDALEHALPIDVLSGGERMYRIVRR